MCAGFSFFSLPSKSQKLEREALFPSWPGCYSAIAHTARLLTYGQSAQPKFWEAQPLAALSTLSCLYIQEMKSECWYKTGWVENWEAGKTEVGEWEGGGVGRWRDAGAHCSVLCPAACVGWGFLALCRCLPFDCFCYLRVRGLIISCWQTDTCVFPLAYRRISMQR